MPCLLISVRFHEGRYHGNGEWPPSPARLFQALIAAAANGGALSSQAIDAFKWLQNLAPPAIAAPSVHSGRAVKAFVPNNDLDAVGGDPDRIGEIRTAKITRPRFFDTHIPLLYTWVFDHGPDAESHAQTIHRVTERLYQLGRGVDMAWAQSEVIENNEAELQLQNHKGVLRHPTKESRGTILRCPQNGSLESLIERFVANRERFKSIGKGRKTGQLFSQAPKPNFIPLAYDSPSDFRLFDIRDADTAAFAPRTPEGIVALAETIRDLAAERLRGTKWERENPRRESLIEKVFVGQNSGQADKAQRIRITPLPSIGHAQVDRSVRRVLVEAPPDCPITVPDIEWAFSGLVLDFNRETGEVPENAAMLVSTDDDSMLGHYGVPTGHESRRWRTVTPAVLPVSVARRRIDPSRIREEAKSGTERLKEHAAAERAVRQALRHANVLTPVQSVCVQREPFEAKGERAESFAGGTRFAKERLWHAEVAFAEQLRGPLIIGDGRYLGLGLMAPVENRFQDAFTFQVRSDVRLSFGTRSAIVEAVRRALMSRERDANGGKVSVLFSGHGNGAEPARSGRHEHVYLCADGSRDRDTVDRLHVIAPWRVDRSWAPSNRDENRKLFESVVAGLHTVRAGAAGILSLEPVIGAEYDDPIFRSAKKWTSHTPYRPTRHAKRNQDTAAFAASDLLCECLRRGLPRPEIVITESVNGPHGGASIHARLQFKITVAGPILLGRDAHAGGGLFVPEN